MTPLRRCRSMSALVAVLTIAFWLIASNHCALAALERPLTPAHACCHEEESGRPAAPAAMQCCEAFNVPVPEHVTAPVGHYFELPAVCETATAALVPVRPENVSFPARAHGPPRALSFAELILGSSLRSHAPPVLVA